MQLVAGEIHLATRSPTPQERPTRPDEDSVMNWVVLQIIVDRANAVISRIEIAQARNDGAHQDLYVWHNLNNFVHQQLRVHKFLLLNEYGHC